MKITISGHSGIGKTTLAMEISKNFGIPFVTTSSKTSWDRLGIKSQADIIKRSAEDPTWGIQFQLDLINYRIDELGKYPNYVTDRSILDNWVYFIINNSANATASQTQSYLDVCRQVAISLPEDSVHIHLASSWDMLTTFLEDDDKRVSNKYFQNMVNSVFEEAIKRRDIPLHNFAYLSTWDWQYKWDRVRQEIERCYKQMNCETRNKLNIK